MGEDFGQLMDHSTYTVISSLIRTLLQTKVIPEKVAEFLRDCAIRNLSQKKILRVL